jgi:SAM-dependent methyltransferase
VDGLVCPTRQRGDLKAAADLLSERLQAAWGVVERLRRPSQRAGSPEAQALRSAEWRLKQWQSITRAVHDCLAGHKWPLLPTPPARLSLRAAQGTLMSNAFTRAHRAFNPALQDPATAEQGAFDDIPMDTADFIAAVHLAYRIRLAVKTAHPWRFLDVGCGGGMKVALAADFFDEATGIELDPGFVQSATQTFAAMGSRRCEVIEADALAFDGYGRFDVIYLYRPLRDLEALMQLEHRIIDESPADAILIAPYRSFALRAAQLGCTHIGGHVYLKRPPDRQLARLLIEVRRMGPHVYGTDDDPPRGLGWLRPLWLACAANGICPA